MRLSPSLSFTGAICSGLFSSSYFGLMISVVSIRSLGVDWEVFVPSLSLAGFVLWALRISLFVGPSLCLTGVLLIVSSKIIVLSSTSQDHCGYV